jgi:hypothetical protein
MCTAKVTAIRKHYRKSVRKNHGLRETLCRFFAGWVAVFVALGVALAVLAVIAAWTVAVIKYGVYLHPEYEILYFIDVILVGPPFHGLTTEYWRHGHL